MKRLDRAGSAVGSDDKEKLRREEDKYGAALLLENIKQLFPPKKQIKQEVRRM